MSTYGVGGYGLGGYGGVTYRIRYNGRSGSITYQEFRDIAASVQTWVNNSPNREWRSISYNFGTDQLAIVVAIVGLTQSELDAEISTITSGIASINSTHSATFPTAQGISITPE